MERTKRKNVFRAELIIFLAVIVVSLLVLWIRWENSHATYKNYDIVVKKNVYCEKTQTASRIIWQQKLKKLLNYARAVYNKKESNNELQKIFGRPASDIY